MAYDYRPGEGDDTRKQYLLVAGVVVVIAAVVVYILYTGLGIDRDTLKLLMGRIKLDAANLTFVFVFVMAAVVLWGLFRDRAATEDVSRRQTYFILLLLLVGVVVAGTIFFRRMAKPTHEVLTVEVCPRCGGTGRAKLRPEYPCAKCAGTGYLTP